MSRLLSALALCGALLSTGPALAQAYPDRPIRVVVPYAAGGADQQIRPLAARLRSLLGQPIVIESMGGAGGAIGAANVQRSRPDGYTLLYTATAVLTVAPQLSRLSYGVEDFAPVANVVNIPFVVVSRPDLPFRSLQDMVAYARTHPEELSWGSAGFATSTHMAGEAMAAGAGIRLLHVPFQGVVPAMTAALSGSIAMVVGAPSVLAPQVEADRLIALGMTSAQRFAPMPDVPTLRESGIPGVDIATNYGFFAPSGTPEGVIHRLAGALEASVDDEDYRRAMARSYNGVRYMGPQDYAASVRREFAYYRQLIERLNLPKS
jgi:tripartite-type tricarboxylate transporter receptor subunit TctC